MKDEWMRAAMSDDSVVVELLVRLKQSQATATATATAAYSPLTWTVRMPRSRALRCDPSAAASHRNKHRSCGGGGDSSTRCSPNTPLSWSAGAASPSATAEGGFEEDSGISPSLPRSKATAIDHEFASNTTTTSRRSRRKKTFAELKEEESLLLKEKVHLKQELSKLRATFKEQTTENESLKRMKLELGLYSAIYANVDGPKMLTLTQQNKRTESMTLSQQNKRTESKSTQSMESENRGGFFVLPDLNSLPCEDDYCSESLYGMS